MDFSYVARQPILDRDRTTIGYELLFRDGPYNAFPGIDQELATSRLLSEQFFCTPYNVLDNKLGFVNFPYQSLINQVPTLFPQGKVVVEVLEDCTPDDALFDAIRLLAEKGYIIALDDFIPTAEWHRFLPFIKIIKFDLRLISLEETAAFIKLSKRTKIKFLAEKVETYKEFQAAVAAGFHYFQGYFFSKPEMLKQKAIRSSFDTIVKLCTVISQEDIDYNHVERIVSDDVGLSYKLLRYVNSSGNVTSEIKSFRQALSYLGQERLRKFISLTAIASTQERKPRSLYSLSIQRARFAELIAEGSNLSKHKSQAFLTGMFSLLSSLLDQPLEVIVDSLAIDKEIKIALLYRMGDLGHMLSLVIAYEKADWQEVSQLAMVLNVQQDHLPRSYQKALRWTDELFVS